MSQNNPVWATWLVDNLASLKPWKPFLSGKHFSLQSCQVILANQGPIDSTVGSARIANYCWETRYHHHSYVVRQSCWFISVICALYSVCWKDLQMIFIVLGLRWYSIHYKLLYRAQIECLTFLSKIHKQNSFKDVLKLKPSPRYFTIVKCN